MKPSAALQAHRIAIRGVVARHHALNARVFGSVLRGDDQEGSDLDILIDTPRPAREVSRQRLGRSHARMSKALRVPDYLGQILQAMERIERYTLQMAQSLNARVRQS
jgi:predicted nucleotidyltransferase